MTDTDCRRVQYTLLSLLSLGLFQRFTQGRAKLDSNRYFKLIVQYFIRCNSVPRLRIKYYPILLFFVCIIYFSY